MRSIYLIGMNRGVTPTELHQYLERFLQRFMLLTELAKKAFLTSPNLLALAIILMLPMVFQILLGVFILTLLR